MPPISGHGAPNVMKVTDLRHNLGAPESLELQLRAFVFRRDGPSTPSRLSGPRSSPVNGERRRSCPRGLHRSDADLGARRQGLPVEDGRRYPANRRRAGEP
jgi:hypothetical protein